MRIIDDNGDEFEFTDGKLWFWIDLDGNRVGPFQTKEAARKDANDKCWLS